MSIRLFGSNQYSIILLFCILISVKILHQKSSSYVRISVAPFYSSNQPVSALHQRLRQIADGCVHATRIERVAVTHDHRSVLAISIGLKSLKAKVLLTAGAHGRERTTSLAAIFALDSICKDATFSGVSLLAVPVLNPDGQELSRSKLRVWRKNHRPAPSTANPTCSGVDLNRNWPLLSSLSVQANLSSPCEQTYGGPTPLSEPETLGLANLIKRVVGIRAHLDIHSFGQVIYVGRTSGPVDSQEVILTVEKQMTLARTIQAEVYNATGMYYELARAVGGENEVPVRSVPGTLQDYMLDRMIPSLSLELAPQWTYANRAEGFFAKQNDFRRRCEEVLAAVSGMIKFTNS